MTGLSQKIRRNLVYLIAISAYHFLNLIPRSLAIFLGGLFGLAALKIITKDQQMIFKHLTLCYNKELTPKQKVNIGRCFFINSGKNIAELVRFEKHYDTEIKPSITVEGLHHFDNAYKRGKGVFGVTAHLGNFELLAVHLARFGYRIAVIGRKLADDRLDSLLVRNRQKMGVTNFYSTDSPLGIIKWLKSGGAVGVLIDFDSGRLRGIYLPVAGRPAKVPVGQTVISLETGSALVPMACIREDNNRYRVIIRPEIPIIQTGNHKSDIYRTTQTCYAVLEELIDQYKEQWIWMHNRWRTPPELFGT